MLSERQQCDSVPIFIGVANQTEGFGEQKVEVKNAMFKFAYAFHDFATDPSDQNKIKLQATFAEVERCEGRPIMAIELALRIFAEVSQSTLED